MVTATQYFGNPINCIPGKNIPNDLLNTYCWIHTTFSIEDAWSKEVGVDVPYPGVNTYTPGQKRIYHAYYQWVCFVLFFQAVLFYIPRYLWKSNENGLCKNLLCGLNSPLVDYPTKKTKIGILVQYLKNKLNNHNSRFTIYVMAEMLNLVNVFIQLIIMDRFLGGQFTSYGWNIMTFSDGDSDQPSRFDPMIKVFPRVTKCHFHLYGSSGDVEKHDAMCILPINILNEKIYFVLWFWFSYLFVVSSFAVLYRGLIIVKPSMRVFVTRTKSRLVVGAHLQNIVSQVTIGDWFMLDLLSKNLDPVNFRELIETYYVLINKSDRFTI